MIEPKLKAVDYLHAPKPVTAVVYNGDCIEVMKQLPDNSVDSVVTDPPYAISFDGDKDWDTFQSAKAFGKWCEEWSAEALRILKPGGHMLAFGGSRMFHRLACGMEDAGFEIRDVIGWIYSQGFPAGVDISKAIDKSLGVEPTLTKFHKFGTNAPGLGKGMGTGKSQKLKLAITIPTSEEAKPWHNWHTALKPSFEPCVVGRKPLAGTVHANVMEYGTGGLNIGSTYPEKKVSEYQQEDVLDEIEDTSVSVLADIDRWPPNVVFGHSIHCDLMGCAPGCQYRELQIQTTTAEVFPAFRHNSKAKGSERPKIQLEDGEMLHTTVKPYELIRWLVKLVTPLGGTVLEPFAGSGTAVQICLTDGFNCVAIERDADYMNLIRARLDEIPGLEIEEADDDLAGTSPHS